MFRFWRYYAPNLILLLLTASVILQTTAAPLPWTQPQSPNRDTGNYFLPDYGNTLIAAHRAGRGVGPENTLLSVKNTLEDPVKSDILEMDLQITRDGKIVLYHSLFLDEYSDAEEVFGRSNTPVFSKTYAELRQLNMGEMYIGDGSYPYRGLRGEEVPEDIRMVSVEEVLDYVETNAPGEYRYVMEIKYPIPWANRMVQKLYGILEERALLDRVIVASFWPGATKAVDRWGGGKMLRAANPVELISFYLSFQKNEDLSDKDIPYMALQMPYYRKEGKVLYASFGQTELIDYAHRYGLSVQYWTVSKMEDAQAMYKAGADVIMTNHPDRVREYMSQTELYEERVTE